MKAFDEPIYVTRPLLPPLEELHDILKEIWQDKWLTNNGSKHTVLEERLRQYLRVSRLSLFNNGTVALLVALKALGLTGEVITTPFTFAATPHSIEWMGLQLVFADIDPNTLNLDPARVERAITNKTCAILPVHVFGTPCDVVGFQQIADKYGLKLIYDAAHAFGVEVQGSSIGSFGDITMFSFHATKLFNSAEGGALVCGDEDLKKRFDLMKNFGIKNEEVVEGTGINGKMNELQAAMGLAVLKYVDLERARRERLKRTYVEELRGIPGIRVLEDLPGVKSSSQYLAVLVNEQEFGRSRDYVYERFKDYNVFARKYFYPLCSNFTAYRRLPSADPENLQIANLVGKQVLCLPFYGSLSPDDVKNVCLILRSFREH